MKTPIVAVLDTNVLISAMLSEEGAAHEILERLANDEFGIVLSIPLFEEYRAKFDKKRAYFLRYAAKKGIALSDADIDNLLAYLAATAAWLPILGDHAGLTSDTKDDHIAALARDAGAGYLVTHDGDFDKFRSVYNGHVMKAGEFLRVLRGKR